MSRLNEIFEFSTGQLRFMTFLVGLALVMGFYLFLRSYAMPEPESPALPVFMADEENSLTGLFLVDPNTSPADSLELLPGIGKVLADRIVAYRQHNRFEKPVDITRVKGIGVHTYERLKPYLKIRQ